MSSRRALEYFSGLPRRIVLDNLRAAHVHAVLHDPVAQRSYQELAEHERVEKPPPAPVRPGNSTLQVTHSMPRSGRL